MKTLFSGVILSNSIFAPAKTGLSSFLINDLIPAAIEENFLPVYVDLSEKSIPLPLIFLLSIERSMINSSVSNYSFNVFKGLFFERNGTISRKNDYKQKQLPIDGKLLEEKNYLRLFDQQVKKIIAYKNIFFIIDGVENMLLGQEGESFVKYFAALLDGNRNTIKSIYATSDMKGWNVIFKNNASPLNSEGAFIHKLPVLSRVFLREVLSISGINANLEELNRCFEISQFMPAVLIDGIYSWRGPGSISLTDHFLIEIRAK